MAGFQLHLRQRQIEVDQKTGQFSFRGSGMQLLLPARRMAGAGQQSAFPGMQKVKPASRRRGRYRDRMGGERGIVE